MTTPSSMVISSLPQTMKAARGMDYGDIDTVLHVANDIPTPSSSGDLPKNCMLIRVLAVALAPGDCRVLSGLTRELQGPATFPYIPGGDCCGIVIRLPPKVTKKYPLPFDIGDRVVARFTNKPMGACADYAIVSTVVAEKVPDGLSSIHAAALISASPIIDLVKHVRKGERILVLGASGGVGAHFCQLLRANGASYVVGVSKNPQRLLVHPILCDDAIDYTTTDIFALTKYQMDPFDTIFDFAGGGYKRLEEECSRSSKDKALMIVKPAALGGRFITTVPPHGPIYEIHSIWAALRIFLFPTLWKTIKSQVWTRNIFPKYSFVMALRDERAPATKVMEYAASGQLSAVVDGPFPFTTEGVRKAFRLQESRHAHGKVVISVAEDTK